MAAHIYRLSRAATQRPRRMPAPADRQGVTDMSIMMPRAVAASRDAQALAKLSLIGRNGVTCGNRPQQTMRQICREMWRLNDATAVSR